MRLLLFATALLAATGSAGAQEADRFDIVCDATREMYRVDRHGKRGPNLQPPQSIRMRYAIDLASKVWCPVVRCAEDGTRPLEAVNDNLIVLTRKRGVENLYHPADGILHVTISTGVGEGPTLVAEANGTCRIETFTPFPPRTR